MADLVLIEKIKVRLGITGDYHNDLLSAYADDVINYLRSGGVPSDILADERSIGVISRGVSDLWNLGSGDGRFSEVFFQRATQLSYLGINDVEGGGGSCSCKPLTEGEIDQCTKNLESGKNA